jgi:DNA-binding MarR family transcriptional regulator
MRSINEDIPESLRSNVGFLLNRAARLIRDTVGKSLTPSGLTLPEYVVLRMIDNKIAQSQKAIGEKYGIDRTSMVELVDGLQERELVLRQINPQDRRSYILVLTSKGRKTLARAKRLAGKAHQEFLQPLSTKEWNALQNSLCKLISR